MLLLDLETISELKNEQEKQENWMKVTFYPRDIGRWRGVFDFNYIPTLVPSIRSDRKEFHNRSELIKFLKQHGVILTDAENPLTITKHFGEHPTIKGEVYDVIQWTLLGWIKEHY